MTNLVCSVDDCAYNSHYLCGLSQIQVAGANAKDSHTTCCGSYQSKSEGVTNCVNCDSLQKETEIGCEAENCAFNEDCCCNANEIEVCGCGTNSAKGTECSTFQPK